MLRNAGSGGCICSPANYGGIMHGLTQLWPPRTGMFNLLRTNKTWPQTPRQQDETQEDPFYIAFRGSFTSLMQWAQLDAFWDTVKAKADSGWYAYCIGEPVPVKRLTAAQARIFVKEVDALLRRDHDETYCGIVYTDSKTEPTFIKIFDPNHLGVSCGSSKNPPLPGWTLTLLPPAHLESKRPLPEGRRRWWKSLWT